MFLEFFAPFAVGFVGSFHCLGMCGPLILAYSLQVSGQGESARSSVIRAGLWHHFFFHAGRLLTYGFLGALGAGLFYMANLALLFKEMRGSLTVIGGVLMILLGLVVLKALPLPGFFVTSSGEKRFLRLGSTAFLLHSKRSTSRVALGLAAGFLPCGLSWAMIVKAAATQYVPLGFLTMIAFGLGTVPVLFLTGTSASFLSVKARVLGERIAGLSVILMGLMLVYKGGRILV